jgi:hypothetical protein
MTLKTVRLREIAERRSPSLRWGEAEQIATELLANREAPPVGFDELADAVKEVTGGIRMEFAPGTFKGHQPVPFMNFTSLSRVVEMFRTVPPEDDTPTTCDMCGHDAWPRGNGAYECDEGHIFDMRRTPPAPASAQDEIEPDSIDVFVAQVCGDLPTSNL